MDFDKIVADHKCRSCIISVEKYPDGTYGNIRVVAANRAHRDDSEKVFGRPFVPDSPYSDSLPQDKNFEDFMYRCACLGQPLHTYVHVERMGLWVNMFLLPLEYFLAPPLPYPQPPHTNDLYLPFLSYLHFILYYSTLFSVKTPLKLQIFNSLLTSHWH